MANRTIRIKEPVFAHILTPHNISYAVDWFSLRLAVVVESQRERHYYICFRIFNSSFQAQITCTLSDDEMKSKKGKRKVLPECLAQGDGKEKTIEIFKDALPADTPAGPRSKDHVSSLLY